jgi:hypothetical protein
MGEPGLMGWRAAAGIVAWTTRAKLAQIVATGHQDLPAGAHEDFFSSAATEAWQPLCVAPGFSLFAAAYGPIRMLRKLPAHGPPVKAVLCTFT